MEWSFVIACCHRCRRRRCRRRPFVVLLPRTMILYMEKVKPDVSIENRLELISGLIYLLRSPHYVCRLNCGEFISVYLQIKSHGNYCLLLFAPKYQHQCHSKKIKITHEQL